MYYTSANIKTISAGAWQMAHFLLWKLDICAVTTYLHNRALRFVNLITSQNNVNNDYTTVWSAVTYICVNDAFDSKLLTETMLMSSWLGSRKQTFVKWQSKYNHSYSPLFTKTPLKMLHDSMCGMVGVDDITTSMPKPNTSHKFHFNFKLWWYSPWHVM